MKISPTTGRRLTIKANKFITQNEINLLKYLCDVYLHIDIVVRTEIIIEKDTLNTKAIKSHL